MKVLFPFTLFLALFALVLGIDLCPPPNLIEPCKCTYGGKPVTYECSYILDQDTIEGVFKNSLDWPLNAIQIRHSSLQYVNTTLMESKEISDLQIYDSRFTSLFSSPPEKGNKLKRILLWNSTFMRGLHWKFFTNLFLTEIHIRDVPLNRISNSFVENINPALETLYLNTASIRALHNESFAQLTSLEVLFVSDNSLQVIQRSMFPKETVLFSMDFSRNNIEILPDDIFSNMPRLRWVFLDNNRLKAFPSAVWEGVFHQLSAIDVLGNQILCDCKVKWMTKKKFVGSLEGNCDTPDYFNGKKLSDLTEQDFYYCGQRNELDYKNYK